MTSLDTAGTWIALAPFVVGSAFALVKPFLFGEQDLERRVALHTAAMRERLAQQLVALISRPLEMNDPAELRGGTEATTDEAGNFVKESIRVYDVIQCVKRIRSSCRRCYTWLLLCTCMALAIWVLALAIPSTRLGISAAAIALIVAEFAIAFRVRHYQERLREYEDTT